MKRPIIEIDRDKCNGCGLCINACAEGALVIDEENKAKLVREIYCDGLGACLDVCPTGALKVVEKECDGFDEKATDEHVKKTKTEEKKVSDLPCGCPGTMAKSIKKESRGGKMNDAPGVAQSELTQWPVQLHLVSPYAPYFNECDLLIAADCTAFALGSFHDELLSGKKLVIACPKLDDTSKYIEKIKELLKSNTIYSLTVAIMSVPCCNGLMSIVSEAVKLSGKDIAIKKVVVDIEGKIIS